jgi:excisionase family DNA binding protein
VLHFETNGNERQGRTVQDFLTLTDAARYLGVSRQTLWRRIREGVIPVHVSEFNRRERLVKRADLDRVRTPRTIEITTKTENAQ